MRIVIIGDIHLYDLAFRPWQLMGKRLLGQINLWTHRKHVFNPALLEPVLTRAMSLDPDWIVFSGDLTTTALESEFAMAADALKQSLGPMFERKRVMIVPGNHDRYTFRATRRKRFEAHLGESVPAAFPHVVKLTPRWRMVGLDSCCPRLVSSRGRMGKKQLRAFEDIVTQNPAGDGLLVVCHYPLDVPPDYLHRWSHQLADKEALVEVLAKANGPVIFVHGHIHRPWQWQPLDMGQASFRVINAGSPCMTTGDFPAGQGFWTLDLPQTPAANGHTADRPTEAAPAHSDAANALSNECQQLVAHRPYVHVPADPASGVAIHSRFTQGDVLSWREEPVALLP